VLRIVFFTMSTAVPTVSCTVSHAPSQSPLMACIVALMKPSTQVSASRTMPFIISHTARSASLKYGHTVSHTFWMAPRMVTMVSWISGIFVSTQALI